MFEGWDAVVLARAQFAFTMSFHIVFPAFSIGLASYLAVLEALWLITKREVYINLFNYWLKIFAVAFGMGVVSGIVMSFQFGTNWARLSEVAGNVLGPLLSYEVLTAFFLEAAFLGVLLFGHDNNAYWYGSQLSIEETRKLAPYQNATGLQVTSAVLAGMVWALENPEAGIVEADEIELVDISPEQLRVRLQAGGGMVPGAVPEEEVTEIRAKLLPMRRALGIDLD